MKDLVIFILGGLIGVGLGSYFTAIAKPQKQWSELTDKEKNIRIWVLSTAILSFVFGILVLFIYNR